MYDFRKCLMHSVSGRYDDDRWRNAPGVFRKASETFFDFRSLPSRHGNCRSTCRHCTKFFLSLLYPFYLYIDWSHSNTRPSGFDGRFTKFRKVNFFTTINKSPPKFEIVSSAAFDNRNCIAIVKRSTWHTFEHFSFLQCRRPAVTKIRTKFSETGTWYSTDSY